MKTNLAKFINMVLSVRQKWEAISVRLLFLHHLNLFLLMPQKMGNQQVKKIPMAYKAYLAENVKIGHHLGCNGTFLSSVSMINYFIFLIFQQCM